ncbi:VOC family protein [Actinomadura sp. LOL_016]|uniref:VOC family protein n=1 Tax=unclassified Actinomadura TaxID=2626254 RepID=UPI001749E22E|nr:glyoxalase [Actinomadura cremea]
MNREFELGGINHLALVCSDMQRTIDFYSGVLGMPLIKTLDLPGGMGQHFFFDCGGGDCVAFFWFPDAPDAVPGISSPKTRPEQGELLSAVGSMNHVAFHVPVEKFEEYRTRLKEKGVEVSPILNHDDSEFGVAPKMQDGVFVRSFYFQDPDGVLLEFACWTRTFTDADVSHTPKTAADRRPAKESNAAPA